MVSYNNQKYNLIKEIKINGNKVEDNPIINEGDRIDIVQLNTLGDFLEFLNVDVAASNILINGREAKYDTPLKEEDVITVIERKTLELIINGELKIIEYNKDEFVFVDIFDYIDSDLSELRGNLILKINGKEAEYMAPLKNGDELQIFWSK